MSNIFLETAAAKARKQNNSKAKTTKSGAETKAESQARKELKAKSKSFLEEFAYSPNTPSHGTICTITPNQADKADKYFPVNGLTNQLWKNMPLKNVFMEAHKKEEKWLWVMAYNVKNPTVRETGHLMSAIQHIADLNKTRKTNANDYCTLLVN
ncbi:hypothetical protein FRB95_014918 [Tulasnella sp. JGI-2019a]|nr:hypothetical protein FRB95_014918 [Tulasnella sp. JGI-2019a]